MNSANINDNSIFKASFDEKLFFGNLFGDIDIGDLLVSDCNADGTGLENA